MLIRNLIHRFLNAEPDASGGGFAAAPAPAVDSPAPAPAPEPTAAPTPVEAPADPFAGLAKALDTVSNPTDSATGQPRDEMGRFAPVGIAAAPLPTATPAPTAAPAAGPAPTAAPKPGEFDLTPPEGMTERAQARWSQLTERAKLVPELERRATEATTQLDSVRRMVAETGMAPQEFNGMLDLGRLMKSANPQHLQQAMQRLDNVRADIARRLGVEAPGIDLLAAHTDLQQKVEGMLLTREDALEIAKLRDQASRGNSVISEQQDMARFQTTVNQAAQSMDRALTARAGTPGHEAKVQYIRAYMADPQRLQAFVNTYQPHQWEAALLTIYDAHNPPVAPAPPPVPQPLRPTATRGGMPVRTGAATAETAVAGAFDRLGL